MSDAYLLATPLLVLGVLALVRFVGCYSPPPPVLFLPGTPTNLAAVPGNQQITLAWDEVPHVNYYVIKGGAAAGVHVEVGQVPGSHDAPGTPTKFVDENLANGVRRFYVVTAVQEGPDGFNESAESNEADAVPGSGFVLSFTLGTLRNDFSGWVGMRIRVGGNPLVVFGLGRIFLDGSTGTHALKLVDAATNVDVQGGATIVDLALAGVPDKTIAYGALPMPVVLVPNTEYYVVSEEVAGGDRFFDLDTTVLTMPVASVMSGVFGDGVTSYTGGGGAGQMYGPVDLLI